MRLTLAYVSDLYLVHVVARDVTTVDLRIDIVHPDVVDIPLSPSFVAMVVEDEWGPGAAAFKAWWQAWVAREPAASCRPLYQRVEVLELRNLPREQSEPPPGMTWNEVEAIEDPDQRDAALGQGRLRVTVGDPGLIAHLEPGMRWASTAYDEEDTGPVVRGLAGEITVWLRDG